MDDIQRKLALLDAQLAGGKNLHEKIISTCPLVFVATGVMAGIAIQNTVALSVRFWLILLLCCSAAAIFFAVRRSCCTLAYLVLACFLSVGAIRLGCFGQPKSSDIRNLAADEQSLATIRGTIITDPYIRDGRGWQFAKFKYTDPTSSFYLKLGEVETVDGWAKVSGTVLVQVDEPVLDLKTGDYIQAYCWLDRFKKATNPGQFDVAGYLARKNIFVAASVDSQDAIEVLRGGSADFFVKIKRIAKEIAVQSLLGSSSPQDESERLLQALVLGYRAEMDIATFEAFRKTGLLHFICLSGMNFGIFVGMIWWLCKTAGLTRKTQAVVCMIAAAMFVLVVPSNPPAFRAAIICLVFCLSFFFRRQPNHFNSLALAAVILLMIKPTDLFEVSWQLSFASVLGILLFTGRIEDFIYEKGTDWFRIKERQKTKGFLRIIPDPRSLFAISLAAWLASAGILLYNFYTIQPLTSIWTVIASPFIAVISFFGYLKLLIGLVLPTAASMLDIIIKPLSEGLIWFVKHIALIDVSQVLMGHIAIWLIVFYYCTILFITFIHFKRPIVKKVISVLMVLAIIIFLGITKWQRNHRDNLVLTCLDVGHGQAILAQLPKNTNILFDAGSLHKNNIGRGVVVPFLDYIGINRIDAVLISHNDIDHINGIPEIVEHCDVGGVYANDAFFTDMKTDPNGTAKFLETLLSKNDFKIKGLEDLNLNSAAKIKMLWPGEGISQVIDFDDNDESAVCLLEFAGRKMLLCSDIEKFAQAELFRIYPDLKADVVVVPHHGSVRTLQSSFLEKLEAQVLIYSCGRREYEKINCGPAPSDLIGTKSLYTPTDGAIGVCIGKNSTLKAVPCCP